MVSWLPSFVFDLPELFHSANCTLGESLLAPLATLAVEYRMLLMQRTRIQICAANNELIQSIIIEVSIGI